jgi:putative DNA methylase
MPNHVHVLIEPMLSYKVGEIVRSWKMFSTRSMAREDRELVGQSGKIWQADYFDRYIRDERHYRAATHYIHQNPVKAGLVLDAADWNWSSCSLWKKSKGGSPS